MLSSYLSQPRTLNHENIESLKDKIIQYANNVVTTINPAVAVVNNSTSGNDKLHVHIHADSCTELKLLIMPSLRAVSRAGSSSVTMTVSGCNGLG